MALEKIDLAECLIDLRGAITIHGDDVLAHQSWEIGEKFLRKYRYGNLMLTGKHLT